MAVEIILSETSTRVIRTTKKSITYTIKVNGSPITPDDSKMQVTSSSPTIATYDVATKQLSGVGTGSTQIFFSYNDPTGGFGSAILTVEVLPVMEIKLSSSNINLQRNTKEQLTYQVLKDGTPVSDTLVEINITPPEYVSYDNDLKEVTGLLTGTSTVEFSANNGVEDITSSCIVRVDPIYRLEISKASVTVKTGKTDRVVPTLYKDDQQISNTGIQVSSDNSSIATYDLSSNMVTGVKYGETSIRLSYDDGYDGINKVINVLVKPVYTMEIDKPNVILYNNETTTVNWTLKADGDVKNLPIETRAIDLNVCTYTQSTKIVQPTGNGSTTITFRYFDGEETAEAICNVTVLPVYRLEVEKNAVSMNNNSRQTLLYYIYKDNVLQKDLVATTSTTNDQIAMYDLDRQEIISKNPGICTITLSYDDKNKVVSQEIQVNVISEYTIETNPSNILVENGSVTTVTYRLFKSGIELDPEDPFYGTITTQILDTSIATYDQDTNQLTAKKVGTTTLRLTHSSDTVVDVEVRVLPKYTIELPVIDPIIKRNEVLPFVPILKADGIVISNPTFEITIGDTKLATYSSTNKNITGKAAGSTSITVSASGDGYFATETTSLTVRSIISLKFNPKTVNANINSRIRSELALLIDDNDMTSYATVDSDNDNIATYDVNTKEITTYTDYGVAHITASYNDGYENFTDILTVNVIKDYAIEVSTLNLNIKNGETGTIDWRVTLDGVGTDETVTTTVEDPTICDYDKTTKIVTAKKSGSTKIKFSHTSGLSIDVSVTIRSIYVLTVSSQNVTVKIGETSPLTYNLTADGVATSEKNNVVISSVNAAIATYDKTKAVVNGLTVGGTIIVFSYSDGFETILQNVDISVNPANMENSTFITINSLLDNNNSSGVYNGKAFNYYETMEFNPSIPSGFNSVDIDVSSSNHEDLVTTSRPAYAYGIKTLYTMPIVRPIKVGGSADIFYPVVFKCLDSETYLHGIPMEFNISKYIHTPGTSDNDGYMNLQFVANDQAWGGYKSIIQIKAFNQNNKEFVSDVVSVGGSSYAICVYLRGNRTYYVTAPVDYQDIVISYDRVNIGSTSDPRYVQPLSAVNNILFKTLTTQVGYLREVISENRSIMDGLFAARGLYIDGANPTISFGQRAAGGTGAMQGMIRFNINSNQLEISGGSGGRISFCYTGASTGGTTQTEYGRWDSTGLTTTTDITSSRTIKGTTLNSTSGNLILGAYTMKIIRA